MVSRLLLSNFLVLAFVIHCTSALQALTIKLSGPDKIQSLSNFIIVATIINAGDEPLSLVQDPNSLLSDIPTDKFRIVKDDNQSPSFKGIRVKFVPARAAAMGAYTSIPPGKSVDVAHDVSHIYDFRTSGQGPYTFFPASRSFLVLNDREGGSGAAPKRLTAQIHTAAVLVSAITTDVFTSFQPINDISKGDDDKFIRCTPAQKREIEAAAMAAQVYANTTYGYLLAQSFRMTLPLRFKTWFGEPNESRFSTVKSHFKALMTNDFMSFTYYCNCKMTTVYAYVIPNHFGVIYLCNEFWSAPLTGTDSQAGTILHEASHFGPNGGTFDYAYGQDDAKQLAIDDPDDANMNADSHEYFVENPDMMP